LVQNQDVTQTVSRWTRFINTNANAKAIENFWVIGDVAFNMYIREKDTGLTYAMGDNLSGTLGSQVNTASWITSGGLSGGWNLVKGPRNLIHATNNSANHGAAVGTATGLTVVLLEESGRAWGQGLNTRGSLSLGWAGNSNDLQMQNPETGGTNKLFQPIKTPGARLTTAMGQGTFNGPNANVADDLGLYITDDGQALYCGHDGTSRTAATSGLQGAPGARQYPNLTGGPAYTAGQSDRYTMHSQAGD